MVALSTGEELSPHRSIQNHRHFRNATASFGKWTGGVLQVYEDDIWTNQDSCDKWVILDARNTFHRVTPVDGERLSIICHTPQHLNRLQPEDWEELRKAGFPVDEIWQGGLAEEPEDDEEEDMECPQEQIMTLRQTSPVLSEPEFDEDKIDIGSSEIVKPTLQSLVWLAELVATTSMKNERIPRKGPRWDLTQLLARNLWVLENPDATDEDTVSIILTIPSSMVWKWLPNMYGLKRLCWNSKN